MHAVGGAATAFAVGAAGLGFLETTVMPDTAPSPITTAETVPTTGVELAAQFAGRPAAAAELLAALPPLTVATLWSTLPRLFITDLIHERADVIGNLDGASYADRDRANVRRLGSSLVLAEADERRALAQLNSPSASASSARVAAEASARVESFEVLLRLFAPGQETATRRYLVSLDLSVDGPPLAAIAVGDLDAARYTTFFVPGMNSSVREAEDLLRGVTRIQQASADSAAVLWVGYESPGPVDTVSTGHAEAGAVRLAADLDGYAAVRDVSGVPSELTLLAHSYGSTTAAIALAGGAHGVDAFVMIGSAGVPANIRLDDLHLPPESVYASEAMGDGIAGSGQFWSGRANPASAEWGAQLFSSNGTVLDDGTVLTAVRAHDVVGSDDHTDAEKYLGDGTESLYGIRMIATGHRGPLAPLVPTPLEDSTIVAAAGK
ncbi:hypothetical protein D9V29_08260 [Mycetocola manganoxydans]|uniref:DUF1023 domain-containing protein n=1 Tax=Mycetocola manganoxydans TaxID=699879 RepID=A0A3L6ZU56_9MICO|nr:alpha/beta hydrolase [Mycetocola manganoxydans]RLP71338.1 hypothetical protein D9V29_08260 [Mycetocola manganoxydans]GHD45877.1 hypothetical protein GCM10008097_15300 [Mycetocola manganoxydans]